jgi:hypothetical protein
VLLLFLKVIITNESGIVLAADCVWGVFSEIGSVTILGSRELFLVCCTVFMDVPD